MPVVAEIGPMDFGNLGELRYHGGSEAMVNVVDHVEFLAQRLDRS